MLREQVGVLHIISMIMTADVTYSRVHIVIGSAGSPVFLEDQQLGALTVIIDFIYIVLMFHLNVHNYSKYGS